MSKDQEIINDNNLDAGLLEEIISNGLSNMCGIISQLVNEAMKIERERHINATHYERSDNRNGYANGFKPRKIQTRMGTVEFSVPQVRGSEEPFYPKSLEKGMRSERALKLAIAEMYVQGVSTRKVEAITKELCGLEISSTEVSRCAKLLDEELEGFRNRLLHQPYIYVYLDAQYHKVRHNGSVISIPVLLAAGVNEEGHREIIGTSTSLSEAEVHWREFLKSLQKRGLHGTALFISDDHPGLKKALRTVFPAVPWQRCLYHLAQNAQSYAPKKSMKEEIAGAVRSIYKRDNIDEAKEQIQRVVKKYEKEAPEFVNWLESNMEEGLVFFKFPKKHHKRIRTVNLLERLHKEIKRRTRVASLFPNKESCLRLVTAVVVEKHEEWAEVRSRYLDMEAKVE